MEGPQLKVNFDFDFNRILFVNSYVCNMNCPYCMHMEHKKNKKIKPGMQFGLEASKALFDDLIENSPYHRLQITFSGGEPLVFYDSYIKPMILYMREKEKEFDKEVILDMFTNGTLLTREMYEFFKSQNFRIGISYDGHCGQDYRDAKTKEKVENAIKLGVEIMPELLSVASTFYKDTLPFIHDSYMTMVEMGVRNWSFAIDTLSTGRYELEHFKIFGEQIYQIYKDLPKYNVDVNTFEKIQHFDEYVDSNRAIIARPDGEICIGTTVPVLIPERLFPLFSIGYWHIDEQKLKRYKEIMGDFHIHVMGKNHPSFCETCLVKNVCQDVKITMAEADVRSEVDPMHCLEYLIVSHILKGNWKDE